MIGKGVCVSGNNSRCQIVVCFRNADCVVFYRVWQCVCLAVALGGLYLPFAVKAQEDVTHTSQCSMLSRVSLYSTVAHMSVEALPSYRFEVTARYPHDPDAFTQGLVFYRGALYESTGIQGHSSLRKVDLKTGRVLQIYPLDKHLFGEGLARVGRQLVQLTWRSGSAFIYSMETLQQTGQFTLDGEGWGSTRMDRKLVISDGSSWLRFMDTGDYRETSTLQVRVQDYPVKGLNELEFVEGQIFANIYPTDCIARIDPATGQVVGWINLAGLMPLSERPDGSAVANGIAYDPETASLFVTGKRWPYIYRLKLLNKKVLPDKQTTPPEMTG